MLFALVSSTIITTPPSVSADSPTTQSTSSKQPTATNKDSNKPLKSAGSGGAAQPQKPNAALAVDDSLRNRTGNVSVVVQLTDQPSLAVYNQTRNSSGSSAKAETAAVQDSRNQLNKIKQVQQSLLSSLAEILQGTGYLSSSRGL